MVTRGDRVESRHRGHAAIVGDTGEIVTGQVTAAEALFQGQSLHGGAAAFAIGGMAARPGFFGQ